MLVNIEHIYKYFGGEALLKDICFSCNEGEKIGLVGKNGCGKSTLLKIIMGRTDFDRASDGLGSVTLKDCSIGFLEQNSGLDSDSCIIDEMNKAFDKLFKVKARLDELTALMASQTGGELDFLSDEYSTLSSYFEAHDGYNTDFKIKMVLNGMGFGNLEYDRAVSSLSGGEKTRLALAKLLLEEPELLILDEPTNRLDFETLVWLEEYLKSCKSAIIIVSHDRYFLDKLCTRICEIENGRLFSYRGSYSSYTLQKQQKTERQIKEYAAYQQQVHELEEYIAKNKVRASTAKMAKSREKTLVRLEPIEKPAVMDKPPKIRLEYKIEPTKDVLQIINCPLAVGKNENKKTLIDSVNLHIRRGEHIGLIGANGTGKTSLLKLIRGEISHLQGNIIWGNNVKISYFDQEHASLNPHETAIETVRNRFPQLSDGEIRNCLASVLFHGEDVFKPVSALSGGEKAKLCFALMTLDKANFLILDEPTNHIDLPTKEVLEESLAEFEGTMLLVSHDRYLLSKTAARIVELSDGILRSFDGGFDYYAKIKADEAHLENQRLIEERRLKSEKEQLQTKLRQHRSKQQRAEDAKRRQRKNELENLIEQNDERISQLETEISQTKDFELLNEKCSLLDKLKNEAEQMLEEWASLEE